MVPFTDVVLVLLVIFMVTTPFLFQGAFQVNLPKVSAPSPNIPEVVKITVTSAGTILVDEVEVPLNGLTAKLKETLGENVSRPVMINADRNVSHGTVVAVMAEAYNAGVAKMGIAVEQDSSGNGEVTGETKEK